MDSTFTSMEIFLKVAQQLDLTTIHMVRPMADQTQKLDMSVIWEMFKLMLRVTEDMSILTPKFSFLVISV